MTLFTGPASVRGSAFSQAPSCFNNASVAPAPISPAQVAAAMFSPTNNGIGTWGIRLPNGNENLADVLSLYYESSALKTERITAARRFLTHYGFDSNIPI